LPTNDKGIFTELLPSNERGDTQTRAQTATWSHKHTLFFQNKESRLKIEQFGVVVMFQIIIMEVLGSNLRSSAIVTEVFRRFPARKMTGNTTYKPRPFPSESFRNHHSFIIHSFDAIYSSYGKRC
jgi:hypothetical protein